MIVTDEHLEELNAALAPQHLRAERIPTEPRASRYLKVNGRHCYYTACKDPSRAGYVKLEIGARMLENPHPVIVRVGCLGAYEWYVLRIRDITALLKDQGYRTRPGSREGRKLCIPYPAKPGSKFEPFQNAWQIFS